MYWDDGWWVQVRFGGQVRSPLYQTVPALPTFIDCAISTRAAGGKEEKGREERSVLQGLVGDLMTQKVIDPSVGRLVLLSNLNYGSFVRLERGPIDCH